VPERRRCCPEMLDYRVTYLNSSAWAHVVLPRVASHGYDEVPDRSMLGFIMLPYSYSSAWPQVVLPLLANEVVQPGWVSEADFLTGFALVQAMPGPLFNFAAYLGAPPGRRRAPPACVAAAACCPGLPWWWLGWMTAEPPPQCHRTAPLSGPHGWAAAPAVAACGAAPLRARSCPRARARRRDHRRERRRQRGRRHLHVLGRAVRAGHPAHLRRHAVVGRLPQLPGLPPHAARPERGGGRPHRRRRVLADAADLQGQSLPDHVHLHRCAPAPPP